MAKFLKFEASQTGEGKRDLLIGLTNLVAIEKYSTSRLTFTYGVSSNTTDVLSLWYDSTHETSPLQMRNFFQDKMIQAQNGNANASILNIITPLEIINYSVG